MLPRSTASEDQDMRHVRRFAWISLLIAGAAVAASSTFSPRLGAQGAAANKKVLIFTYPGVGAPGSHGHASLPAAEEKTVEWGKANGFDVTALKGYEPGVGKQDLSFFTPAYLNQF